MIEVNLFLRTFCNGKPELTPLPGGDSPGRFRVECEVRERGGIRLLAPVIVNTSGEELRFRRASVSVVFPPGSYECFAQFSQWSEENTGSWQPLEGRGVLLGHISGRTTSGNTPFVALRSLDDAHGTALHLLPAGDWSISVRPIFGGSNNELPVVADLGISDEFLDYPLAPGESWKLPEVILQPFDDFGKAGGELHRFLMAELPMSEKQAPVEYNTWIDRYDRLDVSHLREELAAAREIGCEVFVVDAGWYGAEGMDWGLCTGCWEERRDSAFYGRMAEFADEVRRAGLGFGLWLEPERFRENVPAVKAHPEWFADTGNGNRRMRLELPEAYAYQKQTFLRLIDAYGLVYLKTDMNGWLGFDDSLTSHNRYQTRFYRLLDEIRALRPEVFIECCASGGMRNDLEALKHFDIMFPTDNVQPFEVNEIIAGFWLRMPPGKIMRWACFRQLEEEVPFYGGGVRPVITPRGGTWDEFEGVDMESLLCANFTGGMYGFTGSPAGLSSENRALAARYVRLFKENRRMLAKASGYSLIHRSGLLVLELAYDGDAILMVQYTGHHQVRSRTVYPLELTDDARYRTGDGERTGAEIMKNGLKIALKPHNHLARWRAELVFLKRIG